MAKNLKDENLVLNIIINGDKSKKEILQLERAISDTNREIKQLKQIQKDLIAQGKKESEAYKATTVAIKEKERAIAMAEARMTELRKGMKLTEMTTGDLKREMQRLKRLLDNTKPDNANYKVYEAQLKAVTERLGVLNDKSEKTGFNLRKMADSFNHYIGVITAGIVTLMGLITGINQIVKAFAEFDDKVADVQKTTGLAKDEVLELNQELQKIDTRTSQENLLGLARVAGKLGISAKQDVLEFVRASDKIGVALAEDLGGDVEDAINQVGKLVDIFNLKKDFGIEQSLLKVGSAINELGASSTANEGYLVNFTNRMAGVAPLAGITIDQVLGLGATLDQFGQTAEVSSTALSKLFIKMSSDAKTYAKYTGLSVDQFKKKLDSDFMGTFIRVLEGVKNTSGGINELVGTLGDLGIEGGRVVSVLGALANNTETLKNQLTLSNQAFEQGTSLTNEFNIKNETAAAKLEKARKSLYNLTIDLGQKLYGAVTISTNGLTYLVKILSALISFVIEHKKAIAITITALAAYNSVVLIQNSLLKISNTESKIAIALSKLKVFWNNVETASLHLLGAAYMLMKGNIAAAKAEMILFNNIVKANPLAALVAILAAAGMALYVYTQRLTAAEKAQKDLNDVKREANESISEEKERLKQLLAVINSETATRAQKLAAIRELRELMPGHLQGYRDEEIMAGKAATAVSLYVRELERKATIEAGTRKMAELQNEKEELNEKLKKGYHAMGAWDKIVTAGNAILHGRSNSAQFEKDTKEQIAAIDASYDILSKKITQYAQSVYDSNSVTGLQAQADFLTKELTKLKRGTKEYADALKEIQELNHQIAFKKANPDKPNTSVTPGLSEKELKAQAKAREKTRKEELANENKANEQRLKDAGLFGLQRSLMTQEQLEQLTYLEKVHQDNVNAINKKGQKVSLEQTSQGLAEIRKRQEAEHKYRLKLINPESEEIEQENEAHNQRLEKAGLFGKQREKMTAEQLKALEILEATHRSKLDKIDSNLLKKYLEDKQQAFELELAQLRYKNHQELAEINSLEKAKKALSTRISTDELNKITTLNQARKALKNAQLKEENAITVKYSEDLMEQIQFAIDSGKLNFDDLKLSDKILSKDELEVLNERSLKAAEMMARLKFDDKNKDKKSKYSWAKEDGSIDVLGFSSQDWDLFFLRLATGKAGIDDMALAVGALTQAWSIYDQYKTQTENKQLKQYESNINAQKDSLQQQLDSGRLSQKKYNEEVAKLDKELDQKKQKIEDDQAARQKVMAIGNVISSTAQAIMSIWAQVPKFDFGISASILTGLVSAVGAAQLAMVMGLEEGGYVTRAQDGKQFKAKNKGKQRGFIDETSVLVSENGKEFVANAEAVANPDVKQVLDIIDTAQKNGNVSTLTIERMLFTSSTTAKKIPGKQSGGYVSDTTEPQANNYGLSPEMLAMMRQMIQINEKLSKQLDNPIEANVSLLGKKGFLEKMEDYTNQLNDNNL